MEYVRLGSTGTKVSEICFGTWRFGKESNGTVETDRSTAHDLLDAAWEHGVNCIPIVGARTTDQLEEKLGAAEVSISDDQFERIRAAYE